MHLQSEQPRPRLNAVLSEGDGRLQFAENNWGRRQLRTLMRASMLSKYGHTRLLHAFNKIFKAADVYNAVGNADESPEGDAPD
jgi:hypothetical protein